MNIAYSTILKVDRMQAEPENGASISMDSENDRSKVIFSPAFQRLQQVALAFPGNSGNGGRSKLILALQTAQIGRNIATLISGQLEGTHLASRAECVTLVNTVETACLIRNIGTPPFGRAGEAAIRHWFAHHGPEKIKSACGHHTTRGLEASDARVVNALSDFIEFDSNPQGLRVLAKFQWDNNRHGLNLTKACIASTMHYLRIAGAKAEDNEGQSADKPGFFSTEAGLVKSIWSSFGYASAPQRHPLNYVVEAAATIASTLSELEDAIDHNLLPCDDAVNAIKDAWLSSYIPIDPDTADEQIMNLLTDAATGKTATRDNFSLADLRNALVNVMSDYAARHYLDQHEAIFSGALGTLFPAESGCGALLATLRAYYQQHVDQHASVQSEEMRGYAIIHGLLDRFGTLLAIPVERFESILQGSNHQHDPVNSHYFESRLLSMIPAECRKAYTLLVAQLGNGRDVEFEEWNARAHLVTDYVAGLTEQSAAATFQLLAGL